MGFDARTATNNFRTNFKYKLTFRVCIEITTTNRQQKIFVGEHFLPPFVARFSCEAFQSVDALLR